MALLLSFAPVPAGGQQTDGVKTQMPYLSGMPMLVAAKARGVTTIAGKSITRTEIPAGGVLAAPGEVRVGFTNKHENEPSVAVNPVNALNLVAGNHVFPVSVPDVGDVVRCAAYMSNDGGAHFAFVRYMPHVAPNSSCADPVLAYAPDGSRVYYAYMDIKPDDDWDILVSYSDDGGSTWTGPVIALDSTFGFLYDKDWIGTHVDATQSSWVYVTATKFGTISPFSCEIAFTRSGDKAASWSAPTILDSSTRCAGPRVVQGSRPTGGQGGNVLVAWYSSAGDGWLVGAFEIRTRYSTDNGGTWNRTNLAVRDTSETPFWLGPALAYHRWWGTMFPDVEIALNGAAHIAYTHDPVAGSDTAEDGDIRYITSGGPPYRVWSAPVTVNDDASGRAQGYVALETDASLFAIWEDHRLSSTDNLHYDVFGSEKNGGVWLANSRVTRRSSISDFIFIGDYFDLTIGVSTRFAIWTDRRHQTDIFQFEDNTFGSVIP